VDRARIAGAIGLGAFFIGLAVLLSLGLLVGLGYRFYGLARSRYLFDRNALVIHWGAVRHVIPMGDITRVLVGDEIEGRLRFRGARWPGYCVGHGDLPGEGPVLFYGTVPPGQQIFVVTPSLSYGISPADREGFLDAFRHRWEMGPTQAVEQSFERPRILDWPVWQDRVGRLLLGAGFLGMLALVGLLCSRFSSFPPQVPLHFDAAGNPDRLVPRSQSFVIPLIGLLALLLNGGLGLVAYRRERMVSYMLWSGAALIQALVWTAAIGVLAQL
jgi:hypothetical protein